MENEQQITQRQVEKARQELDCALTDDAQHVIVISLNSRTQLMAIHTINTAPELTGELLKLSVFHTQDAQNNAEARKHMN